MSEIINNGTAIVHSNSGLIMREYMDKYWLEYGPEGDDTERFAVPLEHKINYWYNKEDAEKIVEEYKSRAVPVSKFYIEKEKLIATVTEDEKQNGSHSKSAAALTLGGFSFLVGLYSTKALWPIGDFDLNSDRSFGAMGIIAGAAAVVLAIVCLIYAFKGRKTNKDRIWGMILGGIGATSGMISTIIGVMAMSGHL